MAPLEDRVPVGQTSSPKVFTRMEKVGGLMLKKSVFHENGEKQAPGAECLMDPTFFFAPPMDVCRALIRRKSHFVNATNPLEEVFRKIHPI